MAAIFDEIQIFGKMCYFICRVTLWVKNFVEIALLIRFKLLSGQAYPSKKKIFGHVTSLIGRNVSAAYSKKFPRATAYTCQI